MAKLIKIISLIIPLLFAKQSFAALIYDVQGGQLMSVSGIEYNGSVWDVELGHSCVTMYSGCSDSSLFAFSSSTLAEGALIAFYNQAIKDNVLVNGLTYNFDTQTNLMFSIEWANFAEIWVPFATNGVVATSVWGYHMGGLNDLIIADTNANYAVEYGFGDSRGAGDREYMAFTRWSLQQASPVSEPTSLYLICLALFGIITRRKLACNR